MVTWRARPVPAFGGAARFQSSASPNAGRCCRKRRPVAPRSDGSPCQPNTGTVPMRGNGLERSDSRGLRRSVAGRAATASLHGARRPSRRKWSSPRREWRPSTTFGGGGKRGAAAAAASTGRWGQPLQRCADECDGRREISEHELRADADDAKSRALQLVLAAHISARPASVNGAIDLPGWRFRTGAARLSWRPF